MRKQTKLWKTKDGCKIRICDMTDDHLLAAYRLCQRRWQAEECAAVSAGYKMLGMLRGEMAVLSVEQELDAIESGRYEMEEEWPITDSLWAEILRRDLEDKL